MSPSLVMKTERSR